ncbi:MAG: winged helix DNA-binding domain-containing protein [Gemmatimonadaceae bacterium]
MPKRSAPGGNDICTPRLANQHLAKQTLGTPAEVVSILGAVQAQDYASAKWGIAQRTIGATDADVEREISDARILRTHILRPTWHFIAAVDIRWMLELTAPRIRAAVGSYDRKLGIDADVRRKTRAVLSQALRGGNHLTRVELAKELANGGVRAEGTQLLAHLMMHAELDGLVCSGVRRGKQFTYALVDECVPATRYLMRDVALQRLATTYFRTRGPATEEDFAWWSGLTKADARGAVHTVEGLESEVIAGRTYWYSTLGAPTEQPVVRLLPSYDEYLVSYRDRSAMQRRVDPAKVGESFDFLGSYVITLNGQIVGRWARSIGSDAVEVTVQPFVRLSRVELDAVEEQTNRYAHFLRLPLKIEKAKRKATSKRL